MSRKRFIAGASCPSCQANDCLRVWDDNGIETVECVECDYQETQDPHIETTNSSSLKGDVIGLFSPD